jgi:hypothetical protein
MTSARSVWLAAGVVATVVAIASAGSSVWFLAAHPQHLHTQGQTASYTGRPDLVIVQLSDGNIRIVAGSPGRIGVIRELEWSGGKPTIDEQWNGRALTVKPDCPSGLTDSCAVNYTIAVPPGVALDLETDSGDITAVGSQSPQTQASSDSGNIRLSFTGAPDSVYASSDSGNVTITVPRGSGYAVHPQVDSGNSTIDILQDPASPRSITAISDDGNIAVGYN